MNNQIILISLFSALTLASSIGCVPPAETPAGSSGPIDGTWAIDSGTCNGNAEHSSGGILAISGNAGTFTNTAFADGCIVSMPVVLTYPSQGTLTLLTGTTHCSAACSGMELSECGASSQASPWTADYVLSGSTLTITISNSGCSQSGNGNNVGTDTEVDTFTAE